MTNQYIKEKNRARHTHIVYQCKTYAFFFDNGFQSTTYFKESVTNFFFKKDKYIFGFSSCIQFLFLQLISIIVAQK